MSEWIDGYKEATRVAIESILGCDRSEVVQEIALLFGEQA